MKSREQPPVPGADLLKKLVVAFISVLFALTQIGLSVVHAQTLSDDIDFDPPVIDHESLVTGIAGELQVISALVVDDRGLEKVTLFFRNAAGQEYQQVVMQQLAGTSNFTASIDSTVDQKKIDYYIEALDTGGNRVLKGFPFFPLVRSLTAPVVKPAPAVKETAPAKSSNTLIYVLLGALAVGLLASQGGGSSGGDDGGGEPPENTVPLTINVTPP